MQLAIGRQLTLFKVGASKRFDTDNVYAVLACHDAWHGVSS
jgi:hypothetical protein